jgi:hypothetical protein
MVRSEDGFFRPPPAPLPLDRRESLAISQSNGAQAGEVAGIGELDEISNGRINLGSQATLRATM